MKGNVKEALSDGQGKVARRGESPYQRAKVKGNVKEALSDGKGKVARRGESPYQRAKVKWQGVRPLPEGQCEGQRERGFIRGPR